MKPILLCLAFFSMTCCQSMCQGSRDSMTPEEVVEAYLDISLNIEDPAEKESLLDLTAGNLHSSINSASDETIMNAFVNKHYILQNYSVIDRRDRTPRETEITFLLVYKDLSNNPDQKQEDAPEVSTENTVAVIKEQGRWLIRDVIGKATTIDFPVSGDVIKPGKVPASDEAEAEPVEDEESSP